MARLPVLRDGRLDAGSADGAIAVDTPQWRAWLAGATAFLVEHPAGAFTVRRERSGNRRGSGYWRAHRNTGGRRHRVYLGGPDQLTARALAAAGAVLGSVAQTVPPATHQPPAADQPLLTRARLPPPRDRLLARPRVRALLERATGQPVTLVCAPAGYGKSTTLASWATGGGAVAWLSLDTDDNHLLGFCRQLAAALQAAPPPGDVTSPAGLRRWLTGLINELAGRRGELHLVLDDYHRIDSSDVHDAVTYLAEHLPHQLHLVLVSRHPPPLPLARWRAQHRLADLDTAQLRLTPEETAAFLDQVMGLSLPGAITGQLHERTEGWVAGLQLAGLALRRGVEGPQALAAARRDLDTYLVTEVLDRLPRSSREFLLRTCVLSRLTAPLCDALTGRADAADTLRTLVEADLFLVRLDQHGVWYRYHHLFADAVSETARREAPELLTAMHRRAALWHERYGDPRAAVDHALAAGETALAARLVARAAEQDRDLWHDEVQLRRWFAGLPEPVIAANSVLCLLAASTVLLHSVDAPEQVPPVPPALAATDAEGWLKRADTAQLPPHLRGMKLALGSYHRILEGPIEAAVDAAGRALDLLGPEQAGLRLLTTLRLVDILCHGMRADLAVRAEHELTWLSRPPHDLAWRLDALLLVAVVYLLRGDLRRAAAFCDRTAGLATAGQIEPTEYLHSTPALRVEVLLEWNQVAEAAEGLAALGDLPTFHPDPGVRLHGYRVTAEVCVATGDEAGALRALDEMEDYRAGIPALTQPGLGAAIRRSGAVRRANTLLAFGYPDAARQWLGTAGSIELAGDVPPGLGLYEATVAARLALAQADPAVADGLAQTAMERFRDVIGAPCQIRLRVTAALARHAMTDLEVAIARLVEALTLAGPGGFIRPFVEPGPALDPLLAQVARRARAGGLTVPRRHLDRVVRACRRPPPAAPTLTAREREVLELLADGLSTPEVARRLGLAPTTVRSHVERVNAKLGARTQAQAVARAYQVGVLVGPDDPNTHAGGWGNYRS